MKGGRRDFYKLVEATARCCALLPDKRKSPHMLYTVFVIATMCLFLVFEIVVACRDGLHELRLNAWVDKICSISILLSNVKLATKWPQFRRQWLELDRSLDKEYGPVKGFDLRIVMWLLIYFLSTLGGYLTSFVPDLAFYSFVFDFSHTLGGVFGFVYSVHYFACNFNDFFIITTSTYAALRFRQIRQRLEKIQDPGQDFWLDIRRHYDLVARFCQDLDDLINGLVLISFSHNMFYLISYLFHQLMVANQENNVTFYLFFPLMVCRTVAVCSYLAWINDESLEPVNILNSVSSREYNSEIGRWLVQLSFDDVALTGGKIFRITRKIFLNVVNTVVTYELVAMQFDGFSTKTQ